MEKNFERSWNEFFAMENHERPLLCITAPRGNAAPPPKAPEDLKARWMDGEYNWAAHCHWRDNTFYMGEAFPSYSPDLGPDALAAFCGCPLSFSPTTSWAHAVVEDWESHPEIVLDRNNEYWKNILEQTCYALSRTEGRSVIGLPDLHPGLDGLVSLRGPQALCEDLYDTPDLIAPRIDQIETAFERAAGELYDLVETKGLGHTSWLGLWSQKRWYPTSCDFGYLISTDFYSQWQVPALEREVNFLQENVYHLDGAQNMRHVPALQGIKGLDFIQWVPGDGAAPMREWLPFLHDLQRRGFGLVLHVEPGEVWDLVYQLDPEGLCLQTSVGSVQDAKDLFALGCKAADGRLRGV